MNNILVILFLIISCNTISRYSQDSTYTLDNFLIEFSEEIEAEGDIQVYIVRDSSIDVESAACIGNTVHIGLHVTEYNYRKALTNCIFRLYLHDYSPKNIRHHFKIVRSMKREKHN